MKYYQSFLLHDLLFVFVPRYYGLRIGTHDTRHFRLDAGAAMYHVPLHFYLGYVCREGDDASINNVNILMENRLALRADKAETQHAARTRRSN